jgi:hypothetical protein
VFGSGKSLLTFDICVQHLAKAAHKCGLFLPKDAIVVLVLDMHMDDIKDRQGILFLCV